MKYLRQSTATQRVALGYFVSSTDGNTEQTSLTIANTDIKIWKEGAITLANKNSGGATHIANGIYYIVLDATDTNTIGDLDIFCHVAGALAVKMECIVLTANVYDSIIAGSDLLQVDTTQIVNVNVATGTAQLGVNVVSYASGQAPLQPTTAGRTLDVSAGGEAGLDWANIGSPTSAVSFTNTTVSAVTTTTTCVNNTNAPTAGDFTATMKTSLNAATPTVGLSSAGAQTIWDKLTSALTTVGSIGKLLVDNIDSKNSVAPTTGDFTAAMKTSLNAATPSVTVSDKTGFSLSTAGILGVWHQPTSTIVTAGTIGLQIKTNLDVAVSSITGGGGSTDLTPVLNRLPAALVGGKMDSVISAPVTVGTNNDKTGYTVSTVSDKTGYSLSTAGANAVRDTILTDATRFAGANIDAKISSISGGSGSTDLTPVLNRLPLTLVGGRMDCSVGNYQSGFAPLQPSVTGRTIDLSITGHPGVNWANIENPTTFQNLSSTSINSVVNVDTVNTLNDSVDANMTHLNGSDVAAFHLEQFVTTGYDASLSKVGLSNATIAAIKDAVSNGTPLTELASIPVNPTSMMNMIQFLYQYFRNQRTVSKLSNTEVMYKEDSASLVGQATISDDGNIFTKSKMA